MKTLFLLALLGFVLAFSLAIPFNGDTSEAYNAEINDLARDVQADEKEGNKDLNQRNENEEDEEDDDENVYAVRQVDYDDEEGENEYDNENALINPGNEVEDPIFVWPYGTGHPLLRRFRRRRRGRRGGWRRRRGGRRGGWRRRRRGRRWG